MSSPKGPGGKGGPASPWRWMRFAAAVEGSVRSLRSSSQESRISPAGPGKSAPMARTCPINPWGSSGSFTGFLDLAAMAPGQAYQGLRKRHKRFSLLAGAEASDHNGALVEAREIGLHHHGDQALEIG